METLTYSSEAVEITLHRMFRSFRDLYVVLDTYQRLFVGHDCPRFGTKSPTISADHPLLLSKTLPNNTIESHTIITMNAAPHL